MTKELAPLGDDESGSDLQRFSKRLERRAWNDGNVRAYQASQALQAIDHGVNAFNSFARAAMCLEELFGSSKKRR